MLGLQPDQYGAIEISLKDASAAEDIKRDLQKIFGSRL